MENAHLRLGLLEYVRITEKASTRIRLRVDRYIGEDRQAHLLSVFGNDSDVGAITAAVHEKSRPSTWPFLTARQKMFLWANMPPATRGLLLCQTENILCVICWQFPRNFIPMGAPGGRSCCAIGARKRGPRW